MILCVMRIPPDLNGHGGSQRAWQLVQALQRLAPVHFVLVSRRVDTDANTVSLEPLRPLVESVTSVDIPEWQPFSAERLPTAMRKLHTGWIDLAGMRSQEAPRLSAAALAAIADQLPVRRARLAFAGRLPSAVIIDQLAAGGGLQVDHKVVDFDDVMSTFRRRQLASSDAVKGIQSRALTRIDTRLIERAEKQVARSWDAVSVCKAEDVELLRSAHTDARVLNVPNVISRPRLADRKRNGPVELLFVGNLSFQPNVQGLLVFLNEAWPRVRRELDARLSVVGLNPQPEVRAACAEADVELQANVPDLEPYYQRSDIVVAPILFGGGTRIKILEAMAYGRAVVSTPMGAEGLGIVSGRHALLAEDMSGFAEAVIALGTDADLRTRIAEQARQLQQTAFGFSAMAEAVERMVSPYL